MWEWRWVLVGNSITALDGRWELRAVWVSRDGRTTITKYATPPT